MNARAAAVIVVGLLAARAARADDKARIAGAKKLFAAQIAHLGSDDTAALWAGGAAAWFPGHPVAQGDADVGTAQQLWAMGPPYLGAVTAKQVVVGWQGSWGWVAAEIVVTQRPYSDSSSPPAREEKHKYHWLELMVADGDVVKPKALMVTDTRPDAKLVTRDGPATPVKAGALASLLASPTAALAQLAKDANVVALGSSDRERGFGVGAAKRQLAAWKKLQLTVIGAPTEVTRGDLGFAFAEVELLYKGKPVTLRGFVIARQNASGAWEVVALDYGADSEFGDPEH